MGMQLIATAATMNLSLNYRPKDADTELGDWYTTVQVHDSNSRLLNSLSPMLLYAIETQNITLNSHHFIVEANEYIRENNPDVKLVGTSYSILGKYKFAVILEGKEAPIYATQFHPEIRYNTRINNITSNSMSQEMSNFFVSEARKNNQSFSDAELNSLLIFNCANSYKYGAYNQIYIINITNGTS